MSQPTTPHELTTPHEPTTPHQPLTEEGVKALWRRATWDVVSESGELISLSPCHVEEVGELAEEPHFFDFDRITRELIFRRELVCTGKCDSPSCAVVRQTGGIAYQFALMEDLFATRQPKVMA